VPDVWIAGPSSGPGYDTVGSDPKGADRRLAVAACARCCLDASQPRGATHARPVLLRPTGQIQDLKRKHVGRMDGRPADLSPHRRSR
jgi:hypothetical protein